MSPTIRWGLVAVAAIAAAVLPSAVVLIRGAAADTASPAPVTADFGDTEASAQARRLAGWVARSSDNARAPFIVIDKLRAHIYVFDAGARLRASSPVLLGSAPGDDTAPGIGERPLAAVMPEERTTPAGRFVAEPGRNLRGEDVLWVSYADAVSIHPVLLSNPDERRLERLATPTAEDNRVSYGCINVPTAFFEANVHPLLAARTLVYILPETKDLDTVFGMRPPQRMAAG
jgi:hypothetical protein